MGSDIPIHNVQELIGAAHMGMARSAMWASVLAPRYLGRSRHANGPAGIRAARGIQVVLFTMFKSIASYLVRQTHGARVIVQKLLRRVVTVAPIDPTFGAWDRRAGS